jgi:hypothetical protein
LKLFSYYSLLFILLFLCGCKKDFVPNSEAKLAFFTLEGSQTITKSINTSGGNTLLIGKQKEQATINCVNEKGMLLWSNLFTGSFYDIIETKNGNLIVVGSTAGVDNSFYTDGLVVEYSPSGTENWKKTIPMEYNDEFYSVLEAADGSLILTGKHFVNSTNTLAVKLTNQGNLLWSNTYKIGLGVNYGRALIESTTGECIIGGLCKSLTKSNGNYGYDTYLAKINPTTGSITDTFIYYSDTSKFAPDNRSISFSKDLSEYKLFLKNTSNGLIWFTGIMNGYGTAKVQVARLDQDGNLLFKNNYAGLDNFILYNVLEAADSYIFCGQSSESVIKSGLTYHFDQSLATATKIDGNGNELWTNYFGELLRTSYCLNSLEGENEYRLMEGQTNTFTGHTSFTFYTLDNNGKVKY